MHSTKMVEFPWALIERERERGTWILYLKTDYFQMRHYLLFWQDRAPKTDRPHLPTAVTNCLSPNIFWKKLQKTLNWPKLRAQTVWKMALSHLYFLSISTYLKKDHNNDNFIQFLLPAKIENTPLVMNSLISCCWWRGRSLIMWQQQQKTIIFLCRIQYVYGSKIHIFDPRWSYGRPWSHSSRDILCR